MACDRFFLSRIQGLSFFKSIGTGSGKKFTPSDADPTMWGLISVVEEISLLDTSWIIRMWRKSAISEIRIILEPISSHGSWGGKKPFIVKERNDSSEMVAAITRAKIKWSKNFLFWRAVPPVTSSLHSQPGLIRAIGIGEAPIGLQGTFSIWRDASSLKTFAYKEMAHTRAIEATKKYGWYSEELFARFKVIEIRGEIES